MAVMQRLRSELLAETKNENVIILGCIFYSYFMHVSSMRVWMGGVSRIHYSLKIYPIIHIIKILGYPLKLDQLFIKSKKGCEES